MSELGQDKDWYRCYYCGRWMGLDEMGDAITWEEWSDASEIMSEYCAHKVCAERFYQEFYGEKLEKLSRGGRE